MKMLKTYSNLWYKQGKVSHQKLSVGFIVFEIQMVTQMVPLLNSRKCKRMVVLFQCPDSEGMVNEDLPNSWECPKCCRDGRNIEYKVCLLYHLFITLPLTYPSQFTTKLAQSISSCPLEYSPSCCSSHCSVPPTHLTFSIDYQFSSVNNSFSSFFTLSYIFTTSFVLP